MKTLTFIRILIVAVVFLPSLALLYTSMNLILQENVIEKAHHFGNTPPDAKSVSVERKVVSTGYIRMPVSQSNYTDNGKNKSIEHLVIKHNETTEYPPFLDSHDPKGPGEGGAPVRDRSHGKDLNYQKGMAKHNFNEYASMQISIHRSLPNCWSDVCKKHVESYNGTLQEVSVVIIFKNEAWTALLRSVHSVLSRTPDHLLREVILVDDKSTFDYLHAPLDKYFSAYHKVQIIHSPENIGLIRARLLGFEASTAPVVVFLDSHIECFPGWVQSLLIRIEQNPQAVVFPVIEDISYKTFATSCFRSPAFYGVFDITSLLFDWGTIPDRERSRRRDDADLFRSPTMPGGLFAIGRDFFTKLGTYDPEMEYWGGENIELSFKAWMCGGSIEMDPCSHIGHVFRPATPVKGSQSSVLKNSLRVAEVWMDDYKNYFYEGMSYEYPDFGNVTSRRKIRESLQCQNFEWYLRNIFPELSLPTNMKYAGHLKSEPSPTCLDDGGRGNVYPILYHCHGGGGSQLWYLGDVGQIRHKSRYLCIEDGKLRLSGNLCQPDGPQWQYREDKTLLHLPSGQCLTTMESNSTISMSPCTDNKWQRWDFQLRRTDINFPA